MLVDEMKAAGITKGVLHGRHTGNARYGDVSNAEVNELAAPLSGPVRSPRRHLPQRAGRP